MGDEPEVREDEGDHRFEIWVGGELAGFSLYEPIGGRRAFVHTEIDERFAGQGLGAILVRAALSTMREAGLPVLPFCPFVRRYIQRQPEFLPLVSLEERARFGLPPDGGADPSVDADPEAS